MMLLATVLYRGLSVRTHSERVRQELSGNSREAVSIWNGTEVSVMDVEGFEEVKKATPFPPFVSLVWKMRADPFVMYICGGVLYRHRYILTAAHCIKDTTSWTLSAHLNPLRNPLLFQQSVVQQGDRSRAWSRAWSFAASRHVAEFQEDMSKGLGIPLGEIATTRIHQDTHKSPLFDAKTADIALVQLLTPPFPRDSPVWSLFDFSLPDVPPRDGTEAQTYGTSLTYAEANKCNIPWLRVRAPCKVMTKRLRLLSYAGCMEKFYAVWADEIEGRKQFVTEGDHADNHKALTQGMNGRAHALQRRWRSATKLALASEAEQLASPIAMEAAETFRAAGMEAGKSSEEIEAALAWQRSHGFEGSEYWDLASVRDRKLICAFHPSGSMQRGDSGGPLVSIESKQVLGVTSMIVENVDGNLFKGKRYGGLANETRQDRQPVFFVSTAPYKKDIDTAIECLEEKGVEASCPLG
jgi:hypothetical protein